MFSKLSTIWMGALVGSFSMATAADGDTVRVFVYDYARVSAATLDGAKAVASGIFRQAALNLEWANCALRSGETSSPSPCAHVTSFDIQLRILDATMAKNVPSNALCLGYAVTTGGFGAIAAVYHQRARNLAREGLASLSNMLGAAIGPRDRASVVGPARPLGGRADARPVGQGGFEDLVTWQADLRMSLKRAAWRRWRGSGLRSALETPAHHEQIFLRPFNQSDEQQAGVLRLIIRSEHHGLLFPIGRSSAPYR